MKKCSHPHHQGRENLSDLTQQLRGKSRKITAPRQAILDVLRKHEHPITSKEILAALPEGECDLATIYRSMHLLEEMGMVHRFDFGDGTARFELVADRHDHHHHLVCRACSKIVEVTDCFPPEIEQRIARAAGFKRVSHRLEFFGICPDCQ
jgi:Fur family ferric uptake transcriptional regulator